MQVQEIERFLGKFVRVFIDDRKTFWTGEILETTSETILLRDKFGRLVTVNNSSIMTISEWGNPDGSM